MNRKKYIFWTILFSLAVLRFVFDVFAEKIVVSDCVGVNIEGKGRIVEDIDQREGYQIIIVEAPVPLTVSSSSLACGNPSEYPVKIRIKIPSFPRVAFGDQIIFSGKLSAPSNFKSGNGRSFDYVGYLAKDEIYYEIKNGTIRAIAQTKISLRSLLFLLKRKFVGNLEKVLGEPHAALAAGLVVGEKSSLGKELLEDFRAVGLIHIIVLSGFNITIVADALRKVLAFLPRNFAIILGAVGMGMFGILVGGGATVVRSCIMGSTALLADLARRDYNVIYALMFAGLLMVIQEPSIVLHDPSFQLSFLATLGLILLASPMGRALRFIPESFGIRSTVASTLATQIFVSPFILYMMGQISIVGVLTNILVLPFIPFTMLAVFLTGASGFVSEVVSHFFGLVTHTLLSYELFIVEKSADVPWASAEFPVFSGWYVAAFYVLFFSIYTYTALRTTTAKDLQTDLR